MLLLLAGLAHAHPDLPVCLVDAAEIDFPSTRTLLNPAGLRLNETVKPNLIAAQAAFCACARETEHGEIAWMKLEVAVRPIDGRAVGTLTAPGATEAFLECLPAEVETRFAPYSMPTDMVIDGQSGEGSFVYPVLMENLPAEPQVEQGQEGP